MASATGIYTLVRQLGGSFGIAILIFLQTRFTDSAYAGLAGGVTGQNPAVANAVQHGGVTIAQLFAAAMENATVISYDMVLRLCGIVFAASIPLVLLLRRNAPATGTKRA
jgi:DHA2 family multidrug resistance protein